MYIDYSDIISRIDVKPIWWLNGVPRYREFTPDDLCIYAKEALLVHIRCQACQTDFHVGLFDSRGLNGQNFRARLSSHRDIGLGDPPNACCGVGATMNADEVAVLQFWERDLRDWRRVPELERGLWIGEEEYLERHREAWRRIRSYEARRPGSRPPWAIVPTPPEFPPNLPSPPFEEGPDTGRFIDSPSLNARRRRALMALSGRISLEEYRALEEVHQMEYGPFERRPARPRPAWAEPLADEVRAIDERVMANAIPGYNSMSPEEREERYCHGLYRKLDALARSGRLDQEESIQLSHLLLHGHWSR